MDAGCVPWGRRCGRNGSYRNWSGASLGSRASAAANHSARPAGVHGPAVTLAPPAGLPQPRGFVSSGEESMRNRFLLALALAAGLPLAAHAQATAEIGRAHV